MSENVTKFQGNVSRGDRNGSGLALWMTGLPASGKSTLAYALEEVLVRVGIQAYVLDGDNLRHGLTSDLGFSKRDREENVRRVAETSRLMADAGLVMISSLVSPYRDGRATARSIHEDDGIPFVEVFVDAPVRECEARDPKGLYKRARAGEIKGMTGVDDPYEEPLAPEITLRTDELSVPAEVARVLLYMKRRDLVRLPSWNPFAWLSRITRRI